MAQLLYLKLKRPRSNKNAIRDAFSFAQRTQGLAKITHNDLQNVREICDDLKSIVVKKNARDSTRYTREVVEKKDDNELDEIEDKETKKALK